MNKFVVSFFAAALCFLGLAFFAPVVSAYNHQAYSSTFDAAPIQDKSGLADLLSDPPSSFVPAPSEFFVDFFYDYIGYDDDYYVRVYFQSSTTSTPEWSNKFYYLYNSDSVSVSSLVYYKGSSGWGFYSYLSPWSSGFSNGFSVGYDINVYIINNTIPVTVNGETFDPPDSVSDSFYCRANGFSIEYSAFVSDNSRYNYYDHYYYTDEYTISFSIPYNNVAGQLLVNLGNYPYDVVTKIDDQIYNPTDETGPTDFYYELSTNIANRWRSIKYCPHVFYDTILYDPVLDPVENHEDLEYSYEPHLECTTFSELLNLFQTTFPNLNITYSDLYAPITVGFRSRSTDNFEFTKTLDFSTALGYDETDPSPVDPDPGDDHIDRTKTVAEAEKIYKYDHPGSYDVDDPSVSDFDFSFELDAGVRDGASFVSEFFGRVVEASGLSGFFLVAIAIAVAAWFIFGPMR